MDYINTSHPSFIGGSKAVENAQQQVKSVRLAAAASRIKVCASIYLLVSLSFDIVPSSFYN